MTTETSHPTSNPSTQMFVYKRVPGKLMLVWFFAAPPLATYLGWPSGLAIWAYTIGALLWLLSILWIYEAAENRWPRAKQVKQLLDGIWQIVWLLCGIHR